MPNVFLAPGIYKNIKRSIADGVSVKELNITDQSLMEEIMRRYGEGIIKLWAVKHTLRNRWKNIENEDYLLFYHSGKFIYAGQVAFKYPFSNKRNQLECSNKISEIVWGKDVDGKTWPYLIFLKNVKEVDIPINKFNELTGYKMRFVKGFMKVSEERTPPIINYLQETITEEAFPQRPSIHEEIVDKIYAIGELIGYKPERKWRHEGYEFDVVWHKPPRIGPKYVFEVHIKGSLEAAMLRLKHAYDLWESQLFLVSTEDQLKEAQKKFLGELHKIKDKITLVDINEIKELYNFKGKYEWLERRFGLRPT